MESFWYHFVKCVIYKVYRNYVATWYVVESFKTALLIAVAVIRNMKQRSGWLAGQNGFTYRGLSEYFGKITY